MCKREITSPMVPVYPEVLGIRRTFCGVLCHAKYWLDAQGTWGQRLQEIHSLPEVLPEVPGA